MTNYVGQLHTGTIMVPGDTCTSPSGEFTLLFDPQDGSVEVLQSGFPHPLWSTQTRNQDAAQLIMQDDGNLVLYNSQGAQPENAIWSSGTYGSTNVNAFMQDDGNFVLYTPVWDTGTYQASK